MVRVPALSPPAQVPRLSAMLRSLGPEGSALDVGALYLQRKQALEARRQQRAAQQACMPRIYHAFIPGKQHPDLLPNLALRLLLAQSAVGSGGHGPDSRHEWPHGSEPCEPKRLRVLSAPCWQGHLFANLILFVTVIH